MTTVVGVQFRPVTKIYHFAPGEFADLEANEYVIVDTSRGQAAAQVIQPAHTIDDHEVTGVIKPVIRRATAWDLVQKDKWERKEQDALEICREKAGETNLNIKVIRCEYNFDGGRLLVYFSAESRVDFRNLVRELASVFRTRIEMRQIGVRDEAKLLDGVGKCGRQLCCTSWLRQFSPVSIRMAKSQQLPLNPDEISGVCGRLLCCLAYENAHYKEQNKKMPKPGSEVETPQGSGRVRHVHPLTETVTVMLPNMVLSEFHIDDLITGKNAAGPSCNSCSGCSTRRRSGASSSHDDSGDTDDSPSETEKQSKKSSSKRNDSQQRSKRRRRRPRKNRPSGSSSASDTTSQ